MSKIAAFTPLPPFLGLDPQQVMAVAIKRADGPTALLLRNAVVDWDMKLGAVLVFSPKVAALAGPCAASCCDAVELAMRDLMDSWMNQARCHVMGRPAMGPIA